MSRDQIKPWRQVLDVTLIILCWFTISPLMSVPNRYETYLKKKTLIWLTIFSPFTWWIIMIIFGILILPALLSHFPDFAAKLSSFPEFSGAFKYSESGGFWLFLFTTYFLPVYALCVVVLFTAMAFTGWTYREASVYICEYFEPWFCVAVAIVIVVIMIKNMRRTTLTGKLIMLIPILMEINMARGNASIFFDRIATYKGMTINGIFDYVVQQLLNLGNATGTNYIVANILVYIWPLAAILIFGYIGWIIFTVNRKPAQLVK